MNQQVSAKKNVRKPIRLPNKFREMAVAKNLEPTAFVQRHINNLVFYPLWRAEVKKDQDEMLITIKRRMKQYQTSGILSSDYILRNINNLSNEKLIKLSNEEGLSEKQEKKKSKLLLDRWKRLTNALVNYPREMTLEGGGTVYITFNYFLVSLIYNLSIRTHITAYMRYSAEMDAQK